MKYLSLSDSNLTADFSTALLSSLAPDGGLYMPEKLPKYRPNELVALAAMPFWKCAAKLAAHFSDDNFSQDDLEDICGSAYDFPLTIRTKDGWHLDSATPELENDFIMELFHGPTLAFKDFAARFMGRSVSHLLQKSGESRTVLVATSGDTGGAVGHAFLGLDNVKVVILFPEAGVSKVQEAQLTSMGKNVKAIAVQGSFDDCQALVKQAFADDNIRKRHNLMSANSINIGRVLPQSFYYFWTALRLKAAYPDKKIAYSIPSGNLGNLTGALIARKMGAPIDKLVIGNNDNCPFVDYLQSGEFDPRPSVPTLSNAMDIGNPNNFPRVLDLFDGDFQSIKQVCLGKSFSDAETARTIRRVYFSDGYLMCPHTAVGYMAMQEFTETLQDYIRVTVSTAHPAKFKDEVERIIHEEIPLPASLKKSMLGKKNKHSMTADLVELAKFLDDN